jgi:hypothetical protein
MAKITYREALNQALSEEIERDENVILLGEEVAQFKGSYKVSEGMLERFGPNKIIDTPISEAAFSGLAVGAAMMGMRPVVEFMFWSFCYSIYVRRTNKHTDRFSGARQWRNKCWGDTLAYTRKFCCQYSGLEGYLSYHPCGCKRYVKSCHS